MEHDPKADGSLGSGVRTRVSQLLAALGLALTPIALGGMYQDVIKWQGLFGLATHYWDENVRQPLQALLSLTAPYLVIQIPMQVLDYLTLGCLLGVAAMRAETLVGIVRNPASRSWIASVILYIFKVATWPYQFAVLVLALAWIRSARARWGIILLSAPFLIFLSFAALTPNGVIVFSLPVLIIAAASIILAALSNVFINHEMWKRNQEQAILDIIQMEV